MTFHGIYISGLLMLTTPDSSITPHRLTALQISPYYLPLLILTCPLTSSLPPAFKNLANPLIARLYLLQGTGFIQVSVFH